MNTKVISLLLIVSFHIPLISMKRPLQEDCTPLQQSGLVAHIKKSIPSDIRNEIAHFIGPNQWWYLKETLNHRGPLIGFDSSNKLLGFTPNYNEQLHICDVQSKTERYSLPHKTNGISVHLSPDEELLAIVSSSKVNIFNTQSKTEYCSFQHEPYHSLRTADFSPSGKYLAIASGYGQKIHIFDMQSKKELDFVECHSFIYSICFDSSSTLLAIGLDKEMCIFDMQLKTKSYFFKHDKPITSVSFDPSGKFLAAASMNNKIYIFDTQSKKELYSFPYDHCLNASIRFDRFGKHLAILSNENVHILTYHDDYTFDQAMLKKMLSTWLLIEKPDKKIDNLEKLLKDVAHKHDRSYNELLETWETFPKTMHEPLLQTMLYRIQTYGK